MGRLKLGSWVERSGWRVSRMRRVAVREALVRDGGERGGASW